MSKKALHLKSHSRPQFFKIGLYIRVSTEEQAENPEGSIRNQEDRLRQAVEYKNRMGNFGEIKGLFVDAGISAKNMKRPKLLELLRAVRSGEIDLIMVTEISRLSRNIKDFVEMWDMMRDNGCRFSSLREDFDTTTAAGEMVLFQLMNLAQLERKQTSERVEANIAVRSARGLYNGGSVPVGFRTIPARLGYLEADDEMAETVRMAFTAFLREGSLSPAARWMNDNGYSLRKQMEGGGSRRRTGHFTVDNLQAMLRNKAYIGKKVFTHRGEKKEVPAVWPAIVDELSFARAGLVLDKNRNRLKPHKAGRMPYLFTGLVHCRTCKSNMPGKSATGNGGKVGYYEHAWATKRDSTLSKKIFHCEPHRIPAKKLEPFLLEKIESLMTDEHLTRQLFTRVRKHFEANPGRIEIERLKSKANGVSSQIEALTERLGELPKEVSAAPIYRQLERLQALKCEHERGVAELRVNSLVGTDRMVSIDNFREFAIQYRKLVRDNGNVELKKRMIRKFVSRIDVGTDNATVHFIVDREHFQRELKLLPRLGSASKSANISRDLGSNTLTVGTRDRT